jgi:hypothetical protein
MEEDIHRLARQADNILTSDAFKIAMDELEAQTIEMWANGVFKTPADREEAYGLVRGARVFKMRLTAIIENMKLTKAQAEARDRLTRSQSTPAR